MKVSYNWLQEYFKNEIPNPKDLADLLNMRAFEVEGLEEKNGDSIFEIKVTPDRAPDCLGHSGIAKEISIHIKQSVSQNEISHIEPQFKTERTVVVEEKSCIRYMAREVRGVVVQESPLELKKKLEAIGQRSINTIVDITNLVMYELGQPMHAFDADKLTGNQITVGPSTQTLFTTLDAKEVELTSEDMTIQDESDVLAIAGVKGGKKGEVDLHTQNILLESANFFSTKVRKTSKRTGIQTDSSKRYENGLTPKLTENAIHLASVYIQKFASNPNTQFSDIVDVYPRPLNRKYVVGLDIKNVSQKLGIEISDEQFQKILEAIGIEFEIVNPREQILKHAHEAVGKPYLYGASVLFDAPLVFDCSSLSAYIYSMGGFSIPRISIDQFAYFNSVEQKDAQPGDLIFANTGNLVHSIYFETKEFLPGTKIEKGVDHVGVYLGEGKVLHANSKTGNVAIEDITAIEYFKDIRGFGSLIGQNETRYVLHIPYERLDLKTEIDIIEEIGRIYGYEKITPIALDFSKVRHLDTQVCHPCGGRDPGTPNSHFSEKASNTVSSTYDKVNTIKSHLIDAGFNEVVTYTFQKKGDISVIKPLANDKGYLRTNLIKGLTDALDLNFKNRELFATDHVKIFEVGNVFTQEEEKLMLGIAIKSANKKIKSKQALDEVTQMLSEKLGVSISVSISDQQEVVEIDLGSMLEKITTSYNSLYDLKTTPYVPFSLYPFMTRDLSVWATNLKSKTDIEKIITDLSTDLLLRYDLFDEFTKEDKTSYAYRLVFQSHERTLTDEEVNPIMEKIYGKLQADSDFEIR